MTIFVKGGACFIGGSFVIHWVDFHDETAINLDKLTYTGNLNILKCLVGDIYDEPLSIKWLAGLNPIFWKKCYCDRA
jgi:UDP-glucose 4-epimerase